MKGIDRIFIFWKKKKGGARSDLKRIFNPPRFRCICFFVVFGGGRMKTTARFSLFPWLAGVPATRVVWCRFWESLAVVWGKKTALLLLPLLLLLAASWLLLLARYADVHGQVFTLLFFGGKLSGNRCAFLFHTSLKRVARGTAASSNTTSRSRAVGSRLVF